MRILSTVALLVTFIISSFNVSAQCEGDPNICQTNIINYATNADWVRAGGGTFVVPNVNFWGNWTQTLQDQMITDGASWIGPTANSHTINPGAGPFIFSKTFCVCVAGVFNIQGLINGDNSCQLSIDGNIIISPTTDPDASFFRRVSQYNTNMNLGVGLHTITVTLNNGVGPSAIIASGAITGQGEAMLCCEGEVDVNGHKYNDINLSGLIDVNTDPTLTGWEFFLTDNNGRTFRAVTDATGQFNFSGVPPGTYTLSETIQNGWMPVSPAGGSTTVSVAAGNVSTIDFLNTETPEESSGCCDDIGNPNLVVNGSFEAGNVGFSSAYAFQSIIGNGSVSEGMYSVVTGTEANIISNCWQTLDHTYCSEIEGRFMVINGATHNHNPTSHSSIVYQQDNIQVEEGEEYIFCMYYKHLRQCEFDIFDPSKLNITILGGEVTEEGCDDDDPCAGWTKISRSITATSSALIIQVSLDESGIGDGNDLAFDDFSIRKKGTMPTNYSSFTTNLNYISGNTYDISAIANLNPLPAGFNVEWIVEELDCSQPDPKPVITNTTMSNPNWDPYNTNVPGYCCTPSNPNPGVFHVDRCYRITRKVTNCCYKDASTTIGFKVETEPGPQMMQGENSDKDALNKVFLISTDMINWIPVKTVSASSGDINIFPNPGDGHVTIQTKHTFESATLSIYSSDGRLIKTQDINGNKTTVDIQNLPSGVYSFDIIENNGRVIHNKYIKQ